MTRKKIKITNNKQEQDKQNPHILYAGAIIISCLIFTFSSIYMQDKKIKTEVQKEQKIEKEKYLQETYRNNCLAEAETHNYNYWDKNCKSLGLKKDCSLPLNLANSIEKDFQNTKEECFKKFPVK